MKNEVTEALRAPELESIQLSIATLESITALAPKSVTAHGTLDFRTLVPEKGGLFDHRVFGPGTVIDAALPSDPFKKPKTNFARYELITRAMPHPLVAGATLAAIPIAPPDLRALQRLADDRWKVAGLNEVYQRLIMRDLRGSRASARQIGADTSDPDFERDMGELAAKLLEELYALASRVEIIAALAAFDTRKSLEPTTGAEYRSLSALQAMGVNVVAIA